MCCRLWAWNGLDGNCAVGCGSGTDYTKIHIFQSLCSNDRASLISKQRRDQLDAINSDLLVSNSISTCFGHLYAHHKEI